MRLNDHQFIPSTFNETGAMYWIQKHNGSMHVGLELTTAYSWGFHRESLPVAMITPIGRAGQRSRAVTGLFG